MQTTVFREATAADLAGVLALYRQLHHDDAPIAAETLACVFEQIAASPWLHLFVLERDGAIVATTYLNVIPNLTRGGAPYAVVENVVVDEALRGNRLGKQLLTQTLSYAWNRGCYKAMLLTGSRNTATHGYYRACGFSADEKTAYVAHPCKEIHD